MLEQSEALLVCLCVYLLCHGLNWIYSVCKYDITVLFNPFTSHLFLKTVSLLMVGGLYFISTVILAIVGYKWCVKLATNQIRYGTVALI